jgi:hypothetical protein
MSRVGVVVVLVAACLGATQGCALGSSAAPPIGDACLVGSWTLQQSVNTNGYTFTNAPLRVAGLRGATLTLATDGSASEDFAQSEPLMGTTADGGKLVITIRGKWTFTIKGTGGHYKETGAKTDLPTTATLNGQAVDYHSSYSPGQGSYSCSSSSLTLTTNDPVQTDIWSKG